MVLDTHSESLDMGDYHTKTWPTFPSFLRTFIMGPTITTWGESKIMSIILGIFNDMLQWVPLAPQVHTTRVVIWETAACITTCTIATQCMGNFTMLITNSNGLQETLNHQ